MSVKKPSAEKAWVKKDAEILDLYRQLTPENKEHARLFLTFFACDPGFAEAYKALPNAPGQNCPSEEDVERLMEMRRKEAQA